MHGDMPIFGSTANRPVGAKRPIAAADMSRKRRAERIDTIAASYNLHGMPDRLRHLEARA